MTVERIGGEVADDTIILNEPDLRHMCNPDMADSLTLEAHGRRDVRGTEGTLCKADEHRLMRGNIRRQEFLLLAFYTRY